MTDYIDLKKLTLDELAGVIHLYPWYGGARKELCRRMVRSGGEDWGRSQYADEALYVGARHAISELVRSVSKVDCSDKDIAAMLQQVRKEEKEVRVIGGDFFTQAQYDDARRSSDSVFSSFAAAAKEKTDGDKAARTVVPLEDVFCTETMAAIYADQGYFDQAKRIYSKLILVNPEKNAYFASLISKLS